MQQKGYCRQEKFLSDEKQALGPLPGTAFEVKYYKELKVAKNNHVYLSDDKHYYSVPYTYLGQRVKLAYTRSMVYVYAKGERIAVHQRNYKTGAYSTSREHLCSQHQHYSDRSPGYYIDKARSRSEALYHVVQQLFGQDKYPEQLYRTCDGLFSLQRKTDPSVFDKACALAIAYNNCTYGFINNILKNKMTGQPETGAETQGPLPRHENIRGEGCFK